MKSYLIVLLFAFAVCATGQEPSKPTAQQVTVIRAGTLIDGKADKARHDQVIVIRGNRIENIADASSAKIPDGANVIDLSQKTVMPGLIDSHTHIFLQGEDPAKGGYDANILTAPLALRAARATVAARRALEQGFTTLRDVETEGAGYGDVGIKQAINVRIHTRPTFDRLHTGDLHNRRVPSGRVRSRARNAQGSADRRWSGRST
jgi:imidazolonepropionase-like amidohydrolase